MRAVTRAHNPLECSVTTLLGESAKLYMAQRIVRVVFHTSKKLIAYPGTHQSVLHSTRYAQILAIRPPILSPTDTKGYNL